MTRLVLTLALVAPVVAAAADSTRLFPDGTRPPDRRLTVVRTLNDKDFDLRPPATLDAWQKRRQELREQILVATGLWPLPPKTPLNPVVHGRIDRDGYSVEKVFFASHPGHYVSGNLYRPRQKDGSLPAGKLPGVLCPHGHWASGRFYDAGEAGGKKQIAIKAETTMAGARYPLQARCVQLARMGCVVFHYDMVGYADSQAIGHAAFNDADAELRLQNLMGLQTWNSIRALDFLTALPEVDGKRIGVTGASGGGTQTFILCAIDDRPAVAFPAVMVSTEMQGGCVCENCSLLRVGAGNVDFAATFAPKPLALSAANDWTLHVERRGLPELKAVYKLFGAPDHIDGKCWSHFDHNYNQPAREMMYGWFNRHFALGQSAPVREQPFEPVPPKQLSVYDASHPRPADAVDAAKLRAYLTEVSNKQLADLRPADAAKLAEFRRVVGPALRVMVASRLPAAEAVEAKEQGTPTVPGAVAKGYVIGRKGESEAVPAVLVRGKTFTGTVVVWVDPAGKASLVADGKLAADAAALLERAGILAIDPFGTGELTRPKARASTSLRWLHLRLQPHPPLRAAVQRRADGGGVRAQAGGGEGGPPARPRQGRAVGAAGAWVVRRRAVLRGRQPMPAASASTPSSGPMTRTCFRRAEVRRAGRAGGAGGAGRVADAPARRHQLRQVGEVRLHRRRRGFASWSAPASGWTR
ncbi:MAG: hypothetical protein U0736_10795 [Gemmataceae bacterium]